MMAIGRGMNLKTRLNLPPAIQTEKHLALPISGHSGLCASFYDPDQLDMEAFKYAKQHSTLFLR
jgi:hypothetical protein